MLTVNQLPTESVEILLKVPKIIITKIIMIVTPTRIITIAY